MGSSVLNSGVEKSVQYVHTQALEKVKSQLKDGPTQTDCNSLARYLKSVFYPEIYQANARIEQIHNTMLQTVQSAFEAEANREISQLDMGGSNIQYKSISAENVAKVAREAHEAFEHTKYIYHATIDQRFQKIKALMESVQNTKDAVKIEQQVLDELNQLYTLLDELRKIQGDTSGKIWLPPESDLIKQVKDADQLYQRLSYDTVLTPQDYGKVLEYALNFLNYQTQVAKEDTSIDLIKEITKVKGVETLQQGKKFKPEGSNQTITVGTGKNTINIKVQPYNPDAGGRQGKIDVELKWGEDGAQPRNFRISAKNWNKNMKDFGETQLGYALWRTLDDTGTRIYAHALGGNKTVNDEVKKAHELAKLSIIADTVMGFSQEHNYADVLVINQRSAKNVVVVSLKDYFEKLNLSEMAIKSYPEGRVHKDLKQIYTEHRDIKDYEDIALSYLMSNHKVHITYNQLIKNVDLAGQSS